MNVGRKCKQCRLTYHFASDVFRSSRHMHEYAQDAMAYVRQYSWPDLFITFSCNSKWIEITQLLLPGQSSSDCPRHYNTDQSETQGDHGLHYEVSCFQTRTMLDVFCATESVE